MTAYRDAKRLVCWATVSCLVLATLSPLAAVGADRIVLAEEFTATW